MKINKQFILFKSREAFDRALANEELKDTSIVFIEDQHVIWTHGVVFGGESAHAKGFYGSEESLPEGTEGDWAVANVNGVWYTYYYQSPGGWTRGDEYEFPDMASDLLNNYVKKELLFDYIKGYYDNVYVRKDELAEYTGSPGPNIWSFDNISHRFLTMDQYDNMSSHDRNTIYFILESMDEESEYGNKFGEKFPFKFGWAFGSVFPVTLN